MYNWTRFFMNFRKDFWYHIYFEEKCVGQDFENDLCYASTNCKKAEYCHMERKHYYFRLELSSRLQKRGEGLRCAAFIFNFRLSYTLKLKESWTVKYLKSFIYDWLITGDWTTWAFFKKHETKTQTKIHGEKQKWKVSANQRLVDNFSQLIKHDLWWSTCNLIS